MSYSFEFILLVLLLIDSIGAILFAWTSGRTWYQKHFRIFSRYFPATKGWTAYYFILVLFIGYLMDRLGVLPF